MSHKKQLKSISEKILASANVEEEIISAALLSVFFSSFHSAENELSSSKEKRETLLPGGIALSSSDAALCVDDYIRTARFIKGTYFAIKELLQKFPDQKINILYAGCGPYATILLPIVPLLNKNDISITLLDINEYSIQSVTSLITELDITGYDMEVIQDNAITYKQPLSKPLHLVVTETMFHALTREPQAAVTANLAPQIITDGILIPEEIKLSMAYSFFAKEPFLQSNKDTFTPSGNEPPAGYAYRSKSDTLFSMNKHDNFSDQVSHHAFKFESPLYEFPIEFSNHPDICIYTNIRIFHHITLGLAESYITNPYCVHSIYNLTDHKSFKLIYHFKDIPKWTYEKGDKI